MKIITRRAFAGSIALAGSGLLAPGQSPAARRALIRQAIQTQRGSFPLGGLTYLGRTDFPNGVYLWDPFRRVIVQRVFGGNVPDLIIPIPVSDTPTKATGMNKSVGLLVSFNTRGLWVYKPWRGWQRCRDGAGVFATDYSNDDNVYWASGDTLLVGEAHRSGNAATFPSQASFRTYWRANRAGETIIAIATDLFRLPSRVFVMTNQRLLLFNDDGLMAEAAFDFHRLGSRPVARCVNVNHFLIAGDGAGFIVYLNGSGLSHYMVEPRPDQPIRALPADEHAAVLDAQLPEWPTCREICASESVYDSLAASYVFVTQNHVVFRCNTGNAARWELFRSGRADNWWDFGAQGGAWRADLKLGAGHPAPARVRSHPLTPNEKASWAGSNFLSCRTARNSAGTYDFELDISRNTGLARIRGIYLDAPNPLAPDGSRSQIGVLLALVQSGSNGSGCDIFIRGVDVRPLSPWQRQVVFDASGQCRRGRLSGIIVSCGGSDVRMLGAAKSEGADAEEEWIRLDEEETRLEDKAVPPEDERAPSLELADSSGGPCVVNTDWSASNFDL